MPAILYGVLAWAAGSLIPMMLVGAGLSLVTYVVVQPLIQGFLEQAVSNLNGLPEITIQFILLAGAGEFLSIVGSAVLTSVVIKAAANVAGLKLTGA